MANATTRTMSIAMLYTQYMQDSVMAQRYAMLYAVIVKVELCATNNLV